MIRSGIMSGKYPSGRKIPTQQELAVHFSVSRPTVGRALRDLEESGLILRRQGAGSFVQKTIAAKGQTIGFMAPRLILDSKESHQSIFASIIPQMSRTATQNGYALLLSDSPTGEEDDFLIKHAREICQELINHKVAGVIFIPLVLTQEKMSVNEEILKAFEKAKITVTLLDRDIYNTPRRSKYDLVGINNERASFVLTEHLLNLGCREIDFADIRTPSSSGNDRISGYQKALICHGIDLQPERLHSIDTWDIKAMEEFVRQVKSDAVIFVNDAMAAIMMQQMLKIGVRIPEDIRVVGFDDLPMAAYLPVPLTTIRQPIDALATTVVKTLFVRMEDPEMPALEIMVATELIVRQSCGAKMAGP